MIPSIRSMIVAILLAVVALGGGFGVFAEFRVNHEPARLAIATLPLRLAANDVTLPARADVADQSFGSRFQVSEALLAGATPAFLLRDADRPNGAAPTDAVVDPAAGVDAGAQSGTTTQPPETVATATPSDSPPPPQAQATTEVAPPETLAAGTSDDQLQPAQAATEAPPSETVATEMSNDQLPPAQTATQAAAAEIAATRGPDDQAQPAQIATAAAPPETVAPTAVASAAAVERQDAARKIAAQKRLAAVRRVRRTRATALAQSTAPKGAFPQSGFQSAPQAVGGPFVSPPTAKRSQN